MKIYLYNFIHFFRVLVMTISLQMKQSFARSMFRFCLICNPIINTIFLYEVFFNQTMESYINYIVLGAGLMGIWGCICFSSIGDINRERYLGTLPFIYLAPAGFGTVIIGKVLGNTLLSLLTFLLSYITAVSISGKNMYIYHIGYFGISLILTIICFIVISLCFAYALMLSRKTSLYMNVLEIPLVFLCGFTMPIEVLPEWVQNISKCLAPTWAVKMLKMSVTKIEIETYIEYLQILVVELIALIFLILILFYWIDQQIRDKATLEVS